MGVGIDACVVANVRVVLATAVASRTHIELHVSPFARGDIHTPFGLLCMHRAKCATGKRVCCFTSMTTVLWSSLHNGTSGISSSHTQRDDSAVSVWRI